MNGIKGRPLAKLSSTNLRVVGEHVGLSTAAAGSSGLFSEVKYCLSDSSTDHVGELELEVWRVLKKGSDIGSTIFGLSLEMSREKELRRNFGKKRGDLLEDEDSMYVS